jgi:sugar phosphate isomerase/epimerase
VKEKAMGYDVAPMDLWFYGSLGTYDLDVRCEMLAELGYDGICPTLWCDSAWADVPRLRDVRQRFGLDVPSAFAYLEGPGDAAGLERVAGLLREGEGPRRLELAILSSGSELPVSDARGDDAVLGMLEPLLSLAEERSIPLCLYPHAQWWLERTEDAVRLCERLEHPLLRLTFSSFHWYATDGRDLGARLALARPWLELVNLCGSRRVGADLPTFEPLWEGELDSFAVLGELRRVGYEGPIELLGYGIGGDVYERLQRSLATVRELEARLDRHPGWAPPGPEVFSDLPAVIELDATNPKSTS